MSANWENSCGSESEWSNILFAETKGRTWKELDFTQIHSTVLKHARKHCENSEVCYNMGTQTYLLR